jgi:hypothetical protein
LFCKGGPEKRETKHLVRKGLVLGEQPDGYGGHEPSQ